MKILKLVPLLLLAGNVFAAPSGTANAIITEVSGCIAGQPSTLKSHHVIFISNDSVPNAMFYFKSTLCAPDQPDTCVYKYDQLGLSPGQHYTYTTDLVENIRFRAAGQHYVFASTEITGVIKVDGGTNKYVTVTY